MFAYDYPLLSIFWTLLWIYLIFAWFMLLFSVVADIFRNHEMRGFSKAIWLVVVILIPFLGVLIYVLAHGDEMSQRRLAEAQAQDAAARAYVKDAAGTTSHADQISQLAALRDQGTISEAEFAAGKAKILA
ncbi:MULTISPECIES: SHOCT domain-containing protein [Candidatus Neomicrothrix]|jgi:hypothetical protein|uniref:Putative Integral membrane protein n=1 Tax=Candidatus Neomicrothrix parvicella RN1 TaxID=1229780 RepID=R4YX20_9ACTN|nr:MULTISPECIES: SHOCT domain-containing protein [Microthrix]NLH67089.1 SHOCT domain-containing protein [Candidatus Microthrix parvicella]MBK7018783.1 SHOCT domain-containing protein [Candidatus Microthrix sp.]MBK7321418.1 SHOCT domain-containing protein [Candidatus Microthrix sp.]MBK9560913.1 SHOCT domain-containing protein [Candidatus Microthrix sp.]MBL0205630.1 SHOCT domain-containing protein [Candidatus Microthrix sp.]